MSIVADRLDTVVISPRNSLLSSNLCREEATATGLETEWLRAPQTRLTSILMGRRIKSHISTDLEEADPDTTTTET